MDILKSVRSKVFLRLTSRTIKEKRLIIGLFVNEEAEEIIFCFFVEIIIKEYFQYLTIHHPV